MGREGDSASFLSMESRSWETRLPPTRRLGVVVRAQRHLEIARSSVVYDRL